MRIIPLTIRTAKDFVGRHHRHNKPPRSGLFALGLRNGAELVGVVIVGRPVARALQDAFTAEVTRCCTLPEAPKGAVSKLYATAQRTWFSMGGVRLVTYTLESESGASLRGAGWVQAAKVRGGRQWDTPSRARRHEPIYEQAKLRWEVAQAQPTAQE